MLRKWIDAARRAKASEAQELLPRTSMHISKGRKTRCIRTFDSAGGAVPVHESLLAVA